MKTFKIIFEETRVHEIEVEAENEADLKNLGIVYGASTYDIKDGGTKDKILDQLDKAVTINELSEEIKEIYEE